MVHSASHFGDRYVVSICSETDRSTGGSLGPFSFFVVSGYRYVRVPVPPRLREDRTSRRSRDAHHTRTQDDERQPQGRKEAQPRHASTGRRSAARSAPSHRGRRRRPQHGRGRKDLPLAVAVVQAQVTATPLVEHAPMPMDLSSGGQRGQEERRQP